MPDQGIADNQGPLFIDITRLSTRAGYHEFMEQAKGEETTFEGKFERSDCKTCYFRLQSPPIIKVPVVSVDAIKDRFAVTEGQFKHPFQERKR